LSQDFITMKFPLFILICCFTISLSAQRDTIIAGLKCHLYLDNDTGTAWIQKVIVNKKTGKQFSGSYFEFYKSGRLKVKGYFKAGKRSDKWEGFYEDGNKFFTGYYDEGYKSDLWMKYFDAGVMSWKGSFFKDMRAGFWRYFYENGKLKMMTRYEIKTHIDKGEKVKDGKGSSLQRNVKIYYTISPCDSLVEYYQDGTLKIKMAYGHHGGLNGKVEYFYPSGLKNLEGMYSEGKKTGTWNYFCLDGTIAKSFIYDENGNIKSQTSNNPDATKCVYVEIQPQMLWLPEITR
jgi:antitoxin component YwqK of YwqJK toxin-antitoxin module